MPAESKPKGGGQPISAEPTTGTSEKKAITTPQKQENGDR